MKDSLSLHSGDYVERYNSKPLDRVRNLAALMELPDQAHLADFACGNGMLLHALGKRSGSYEGVDFSLDFIRSAEAWAEREGCKNYRFHCEEIVQFCERNLGKFDAASTLDFSEHVPDDQLIPIYSAIRQSLAKGGVLYLHTPNLDFFVERAKDVGILRQFEEHVAVRTGKQLVALLVEAGFRKEQISLRHIPHYNLLKYLHPLRHLPLVGRWFKARLWVVAKV